MQVEAWELAKALGIFRGKPGAMNPDELADMINKANPTVDGNTVLYGEVPALALSQVLGRVACVLSRCPCVGSLPCVFPENDFVAMMAEAEYSAFFLEAFALLDSKGYGFVQFGELMNVLEDLQVQPWCLGSQRPLHCGPSCTLCTSPPLLNSAQ